MRGITPVIVLALSAPCQAWIDPSHSTGSATASPTVALPIPTQGAVWGTVGGDISDPLWYARLELTEPDATAQIYLAGFDALQAQLPEGEHWRAFSLKTDQWTQDLLWTTQATLWPHGTVGDDRLQVWNHNATSEPSVAYYGYPDNQWGINPAGRDWSQPQTGIILTIGGAEGSIGYLSGIELTGWYVPEPSSLTALCLSPLILLRIRR